jgi:hypothetical protein
MEQFLPGFRDPLYLGLVITEGKTRPEMYQQPRIH